MNDLQKVIDPADNVGHKNRYINVLQHIALKDVLGDTKGKNVLDAGCGIERFRDLFDRYTGIDIDDNMDPNVMCSCDDTPFEDATFDIVLSVWMLQYQKDLPKFVRELKRVLKPGGSIYMIEQISDGYGSVYPRRLMDYCSVFRSDLEYKPILKSGDILVGIIKRGVVPERLFPILARMHLMVVKYTRKGEYTDYLMRYTK